MPLFVEALDVLDRFDDVLGQDLAAFLRDKEVIFDADSKAKLWHIKARLVGDDVPLFQRKFALAGIVRIKADVVRDAVEIVFGDVLLLLQ